MPIVRFEREPIGSLSNAKCHGVMPSMMEPAQEQEVVEVRSATQRPVLVVMRLRAMRRHTTTWEAAEPIAYMEGKPQPFRHDALLATNVDRQPVPLGYSDHLGVAADPARCSSRQR